MRECFWIKGSRVARTPPGLVGAWRRHGGAWTAVLRAVLIVSSIGAAVPSEAQVTLSPMSGVSTEGQPTLGVAVGISAGAVRPELDLAWSRRGIDRRAATPSKLHRGFPDASEPNYLPAAMADISTLMFRVAIPLRQGRTFEPFGSVGVGLARATREPPPGESLARTDTQAGLEGGGGATIWLTSRIGLRTAATYYRTFGPDGNFHGAPGSGFIYTNVLRDFSLIRVTVGFDIRLSPSRRPRP
jgi:opacity protein-like surface antigen